MHLGVLQEHPDKPAAVALHNLLLIVYHDTQ